MKDGIAHGTCFLFVLVQILMFALNVASGHHHRNSDDADTFPKTCGRTHNPLIDHLFA
jgi:hypothetical protein